MSNSGVLAWRRRRSVATAASVLALIVDASASALPTPSTTDVLLSLSVRMSDRSSSIDSAKSLHFGRYSSDTTGVPETAAKMPACSRLTIATEHRASSRAAAHASGGTTMSAATPLSADSVHRLSSRFIRMPMNRWTCADRCLTALDNSCATIAGPCPQRSSSPKPRFSPDQAVFCNDVGARGQKCWVSRHLNIQPDLSQQFSASGTPLPTPSETLKVLVPSASARRCRSGLCVG